MIFINKDKNIVGKLIPMNSCKWCFLQTRTLEDIHNIKPHSYQTRITPELNHKIKIIKRDDKQSEYECETLPINITILHTRKDFTYQYQNNGNIINALETYQTIVNFKTT